MPTAAIVKYGYRRGIKRYAGVALRANPYYKRARMAYTVGRYAYKSGAARGAARVIRRAYRSYRGRKTKFQKRSVKDQSRQTSKCRTDTESGSSLDLTMGRLALDVFIYPGAISGTVTGSTVIGRKSNVILVKGEKICRTFTYKPNLDVGPILINWAIVQVKDEEVKSFIGTRMNEAFFRSFLTTGKRDRDFTAYTDTAPWSHHYNCLAINPDSNIKIIMRKRKVLYPNRLDNNKTHHNDYWHINKYFKINQRQTYDSSNATQPRKPFYEIFWYNTVSDVQFPANPIAETYIRTHKTNSTYFSDIGNIS